MVNLKKSIAIAIILTLSLLVSGIAFATVSTSQNDFMVLEEGETLDSAGFFAGDSIRIDGTVKGTVFAAGSEVRIGGKIEGDLFVAAQNVYIDGEISGNIYGSGMDLELGGEAKRDVFLAGQSITVDSEATIERDLFVAGETVKHMGEVGRNLSGAGANISIDGKVRRNANLEVENLSVLEGADINGDLSYKGPNEASISPGASIAGETEFELRQRVEPTVVSKVRMSIFKVISALLVWFVIGLIRPKLWEKIGDKATGEPLKTFGVGLVAVVTLPAIAILFMITIVGMPLGIITATIYGIALYLSKIAVAVSIGRWAMDTFKWSEIHRGVWVTLMGLVLLELISVLDIVAVSAIVAFATVCFGFGALLLSNYKPEEKGEESVTNID